MAAANHPDLWALLPPHKLRALARAWLDEDCPAPDPAASAVGRAPRRGLVLSKSEGVLAGAPFAQAAWEESGCRVSWRLAEGSALPAGRTVVAEVEGPASALLLAERVALNCLGRCSGVATAAARAVRLAREAGWAGTVAGTRKTTPGFRLAEKYALAVGGADPHRYGLGAGLVMLKDNHLLAARAPLEELVGAARGAGGFTRRLAVECGSAGEAVAAARAGADVVLLDNLAPQALREAAAAAKAARPGVTVEASGGIGVRGLPQFLGPHVDVVSMGCLTHGAPALDFAFRVLGEGEGGMGRAEGAPTRTPTPSWGPPNFTLGPPKSIPPPQFHPGTPKIHSSPPISPWDPQIHPGTPKIHSRTPPPVPPSWVGPLNFTLGPPSWV